MSLCTLLCKKVILSRKKVNDQYSFSTCVHFCSPEIIRFFRMNTVLSLGTSIALLKGMNATQTKGNTMKKANVMVSIDKLHENDFIVVISGINGHKHDYCVHVRSEKSAKSCAAYLVKFYKKGGYIF